MAIDFGHDDLTFEGAELEPETHSPKPAFTNGTLNRTRSSPRRTYWKLHVLI